MRISFRVNSSKWAAFRAKAEAALNPAAPGPYQDGLLAASEVEWEALRQRFVTASSGDGTWEPLAPMTVAEHRRIGDGPPPHALHLTGALEASLARGGDNHVLEVAQSGVTEGTQDPHAAFQNYGTPRIPARPFVVEPANETLGDMKAPIVEGVRLTMKESIK